MVFKLKHKHIYIIIAIIAFILFILITISISNTFILKRSYFKKYKKIKDILKKNKIEIDDNFTDDYNTFILFHFNNKTNKSKKSFIEAFFSSALNLDNKENVCEIDKDKNYKINIQKGEFVDINEIKGKIITGRFLSDFTLHMIDSDFYYFILSIRAFVNELARFLENCKKNKTSILCFAKTFRLCVVEYKIVNGSIIHTENRIQLILNMDYKNKYGSILFLLYMADCFESNKI
ncbi:hypothetical protein SLOPH_2410 [Spraguea lophii 42_110]|uniref:Uncharacterized protein n=1 Tax=Spraguea lophii (strain 42_110) TaxID=1358809 RepID=S7W934_SPRLO|nr:hypothetical protein SLOPH_2410 [Spraguea lophii 42_110]